MILFGRAVCGTLGGGFVEKPLTFDCSVRLGFSSLDLVGVSNRLFKA